MEEKRLTWSMVTQVVKLSKLQIKNILRTRNADLPPPEDEIEPYHLAILLAADMLEKLMFLQPEQRILILDAIEAPIAAIAADAGFYQLGFVDGRYCMWTDHAGFLDITTGDIIAELPVFPLESISYNLNELYRRGKLKIERRSGMHAKRQDSEGTVDESADFCERPTDSVS